MSSAKETLSSGRGNFASRKARGERGGKSSNSTKGVKEHGYDARRYHQNANTHGIQALRTFDCPVCDSKNTIRVTLNPRLGQGTVWCTYCSSLRPVPEDLPFPSVQRFVAALENKADVFFRFSEQYNALLQQQQLAGPSAAAGTTRDASRKRSHENVGEDGHLLATQKWKGEDGGNDGLFTGLNLAWDTGLLEEAASSAPTEMASEDEADGLHTRVEGVPTPEGMTSPSGQPNSSRECPVPLPGTHHDAAPALSTDGEVCISDQLHDEGAEDIPEEETADAMDAAAFFAESF